MPTDVAPYSTHETRSHETSLATTNTRDRDDLWISLSELKDSDLGSKFELFSRYALLSSSAGMLFLATFNPVFLGWIAAYFVTTGLFYYVLNKATVETAHRLFPLIIVMTVVTSFVYISMPLWLWATSDSFVFKTLAVLALVSLAIFNMQRHRRWSFVAIWDCTWTVGCTAAFIVTGMPESPSVAHIVLTLFGFLGTGLYYVMSQYDTIRDRTALRVSRAQAVEEQRLSTMDQITAGIAHDFNNRLTAIQGNIELAELSHDPIERRQLLAKAKQATHDTGKVVAQMRAYVRKSRMLIEQVFLEEFVAEMAAEINDTWPSDVQLATTLHPEGLDIHVDRNLLKSALCGLLRNAQEAIGTKTGQVTLSVSHEYRTVEETRSHAPTMGEFIRFDVRDTGPGIAPHDFAQVMDPFYTTKRASGGAGLGLSMVKGFAEQAGGTLVIRNQKDAGLIVSLALPRFSDRS